MAWYGPSLSPFWTGEAVASVVPWRGGTFHVWEYGSGIAATCGMIGCGGALHAWYGCCRLICAFDDVLFFDMILYMANCCECMVVGQLLANFSALVWRMCLQQILCVWLILDCIEPRQHIKGKRRSATLQKLEEGAKEILENGQIEVLDKNLYRISSMPSEKHYKVSYAAGLWSCDCKYDTTGHTHCKHICAVRAMIVVRESVVKAIKTEVNKPKIHCPKCGSTDVSVTTTYEAKSETRPVYWCAERKHRFVYRPGFMHRQ